MAKQFDATIKMLLEAHPRDWLALAGLPATGRLNVIDADVATVSAAADKVLRVEGPPAFVAHVEFQASSDPTLDRRTLLYNVLLRHRHDVPVRSVVFLARAQAQVSATGTFSEISDADSQLMFRYRLIRLWEMPSQSLLASGLGTVPLAPLGALGEASLETVVGRVQERLANEATPSELPEAMTATKILMGLRYGREVIERLFTGVRSMKESVIYQAISDEGRVEGRVEGRAEEARAMLLKFGQWKLGSPPADIVATLNSVTDVQRLEAMADRLIAATSWRELLEPRQ